MLEKENVFSSSVAVPFHVGTRPATCSDSLSECLGILFPEKKAWFEKQYTGRMIISALPHAPFGVAPDVLAGFFFDDLEAALRLIMERFDLGRITVVGLPEFSEKQVKGVEYSDKISKRERGIRLDLFEFSRLVSAVRDGTVSSGILISIFRDPGSVHSFFVPEGTTLNQTFNSDQNLASGELYEPYSGKVFSPDDEISRASEQALVFTDSEYMASPGSGPFVAFPWFNRKIAMRKVERAEKSELPCSNCLSCGDHCPADLSPSILYHQIIKGGLHDTPALDLFACTGCGLCSFVCPSGLPLCDEITDAIDRLNEESDG